MKRLTSRIVLLVLGIIVSLSAALPALTVYQQFDYISYQGRITLSSGDPIADGTHSFIFTLHDHETAASPIWSETRMESTEDGLLSVNLGEINPIALNDLGTSGQGETRVLYLEISVDGETISPRTRLVSAPYANVAERLLGDAETSPGNLLIRDPGTGDTLAVLGSDNAKALNAYLKLSGGTQNDVSLQSSTSGGNLTISNIGSSGEDGISMQSGNNRSTIRSYDILTSGDTANVFSLAADSSGARLQMGDDSDANGNGFDTYVVTEVSEFKQSIDQIMTVRPSSTDSTFLHMEVDSSGPGVHMNKGELIADLSTKSDGGHLTISNIGSSGEDGVSIDVSDSASMTLSHVTTGGDTATFHACHDCLVISNIGSSGDDGVSLKTDRFLMTSSTGGPPKNLFDLNTGGAPTGPTMTLRYPSPGGPGAELYFGDLNGDFLPDVAVDGNVGIGTTAPSERLHVVGNICATGTIGACSDARYKQDIATLTDPLERLSKLRGVTFNWRTVEFPEKDFATSEQIGFIAQEVKEVLPEVVSKGADGFYSIDYGRLTPVLVEAVKKQQATIESQQSSIEELRAEVAQMKSLLEQLVRKASEPSGSSYGMK